MKRTYHLRRGALVLAICLALTLIAGCAAGTATQPTGTQWDLTEDPNAHEGGIQTRSQEEIQEELNRKVKDGEINISMNPDPVFEDSSSQGNLLIVNEKINKYPQIVEIYGTALAETGEVLLKEKTAEIKEQTSAITAKISEIEAKIAEIDAEDANGKEEIAALNAALDEAKSELSSVPATELVLLYRSGGIPVGSSVERGTLLVKLAAGDYGAVSRFCAIDPGTGSLVAEAFWGDTTLHILH